MSDDRGTFKVPALRPSTPIWKGEGKTRNYVKKYFRLPSLHVVPNRVYNFESFKRRGFGRENNYGTPKTVFFVSKIKVKK